MTGRIAYERPTHAPRFRALTRRECESVLRRASIGRLAYSLHDQVDIQPINFVYDHGWVIWRSAPGTKMEALAHNRWVAFQVDEIEDACNWRSVVVHGSAYPLNDEVTYLPPAVRANAIAELRRVIPEIGTEDDPTPEREHLFHMQVDRMTGRAATTRPPAGRGRRARGAARGASAPRRARAGARAPRRRSSG